MQNSNTETTNSSKTYLGAHYFTTTNASVFESPNNHAYYFKSFIGAHNITVEKGDCIYFLDDSLEQAFLKKGPVKIKSKHIATVIRGFMPSNRSCDLTGTTLLPYINACSTKQIFEPPRLGDPTLQYLKIPAFSKEQAHHIHSTVRVVFVLKGQGISVVGMEGNTVSTDLKPGVVCILDPMCPHHFETPSKESLTVVPLHIFSSTDRETAHPMFNGTYLANQGL